MDTPLLINLSYLPVQVLVGDCPLLMHHMGIERNFGLSLMTKTQFLDDLSGPFEFSEGDDECQALEEKKLIDQIALVIARLASVPDSAYISREIPFD